MRVDPKFLATSSQKTLTEATEGLIPGITVKSDFVIKSYDNDEQIAYGCVYAPYVIDSHGDMMLPEGIKQLAHRFLILQKNHHIDVMHNNKVVQASIVESYIARKGDPQYDEGSWVLGVQLFDKDIWADIRAGKLNGYSLEAMVYRYEADIEFDYIPVHMGFTEENDGHVHPFWVEVDKDGRVAYGCTGAAEDGHTHKVLCGTATEIANDHAHRYFLNEFSDED